MMLDPKKIATAIAHLNKNHGASFVGPEPDARDALRHNKKATDYLAGELNPSIKGYVAALSGVRRCRPQWRYMVSRQQQGNVAEMQLYLGFWGSCSMMWSHLGGAILEKTDFVNVFGNFYDISKGCMALLMMGQFDYANRFGHMVNKHYDHLITGTGSGPSVNNKDDVMPFLYLTEPLDPEISAFDPQSFLDRGGFELYHQLFNIWDRPDPAELRNTVQALRERRVSLACMSDSQQDKLIEYADYFWLFYDPLLHAVNMRRIGLGLEPVLYDSYIQGVELPLEPVPFVVDDLLYPAYLKACAELGETPVDFGEAVAVLQKPENGMLTQA